MRHNPLNFNKVSFSYDSHDFNIIDSFSYSFSPGWHAVAGENGAGKSTLLMLACGILQPVSGSVNIDGSVYYCSQRTDEPPVNSKLFEEDITGRAERLIRLFGAQRGYKERWNTLSHGERKRYQLACAMWEEPDILCVDEPFNHVDSNTKKEIINALREYRGTGLLVSHDRETSDELCADCVLFYCGKIVVRDGGISSAVESIKAETAANNRLYIQKRRELARLSAEYNSRKDEALRADSKRSKRHLDIKDHDGREKLDRAKVSGKDAKAGRLQDQMTKRLSRMSDEFSAMKYEKEKQHGIFMQGCVSTRNAVFRTEETIIPIGDKNLHVPALTIKPDDRTGLSGANGTGKSTFIKYMLDKMNIEHDRICYVPQEITKEQGDSLWAQLRRLKENKREDFGRLLTIISRLGSDPKRLITSQSPSPGETRKLMLSLGVLNLSQVIIMDEPTNHMDVISVMCLEDALKECPCCLILVSHDMKFLNSLCAKVYRFEKKGNKVEVI